MSVYKGQPTRFVALAPQGSDAVEAELLLYRDGTYKVVKGTMTVHRDAASQVTKAMKNSGVRRRVRKGDGISFLVATEGGQDTILAEAILHPNGRYEFASEGIRYQDGTTKANAPSLIRGVVAEAVAKYHNPPGQTNVTSAGVKATDVTNEGGGRVGPGGLLNSSAKIPGRKGWRSAGSSTVEIQRNDLR